MLTERVAVAIGGARSVGAEGDGVVCFVVDQALVFALVLRLEVVGVAPAAAVRERLAGVCLRVKVPPGVRGLALPRLLGQEAVWR